MILKFGSNANVASHKVSLIDRVARELSKTPLIVLIGVPEGKIRQALDMV